MRPWSVHYNSELDVITIPVNVVDGDTHYYVIRADRIVALSDNEPWHEEVVDEMLFRSVIRSIFTKRFVRFVEE